MTREEILRAASVVWGTENWSELQVAKLTRFAQMCQAAKKVEPKKKAVKSGASHG